MSESNDSTNPPRSQEASEVDTSADRPSLVEDSTVVQRSANTERVRLTERSDKAYYSRDHVRRTKKGK